MTNILATTDNLGKSLDYSKDNIDEEKYKENKKKLEKMMRNNIDNLQKQMAKKKKAKIESKTPERTLVLQKFDFSSTEASSISIASADDPSDGETDSAQSKGKIDLAFKPNDVLGDLDLADGEEVFMESIANKFNP